MISDNVKPELQEMILQIEILYPKDLDLEQQYILPLMVGIYRSFLN